MFTPATTITSFNCLSCEDGVVRKLYRPKPSNFKTVRYSLLRYVTSVPVEYWTPEERRAFEADVLRLWSREGYRVPEVLASSDCATELCMRYIPGPTAAEAIVSMSVGDQERLIRSLFLENSKRHQRALETGDHRLVHYDANLRNLILSDHGLYHIDFEMGHLHEPILRSILREILKLTLELTAHCPAAPRLLRECYAGLPFVDELIVRETRGPLVAFRRWRDKGRKPHPTKWDVLDALQSC